MTLIFVLCSIILVDGKKTTKKRRAEFCHVALAREKPDEAVERE